MYRKQTGGKLFSLKTLETNLINTFQRVQDIWSEHEIQGSTRDF